MATAVIASSYGREETYGEVSAPPTHCDTRRRSKTPSVLRQQHALEAAKTSSPFVGLAAPGGADASLPVDLADEGQKAAAAELARLSKTASTASFGEARRRSQTPSRSMCERRSQTPSSSGYRKDQPSTADSFGPEETAKAAAADACRLPRPASRASFGEAKRRSQTPSGSEHRRSHTPSSQGYRSKDQPSTTDSFGPEETSTASRQSDLADADGQSPDSYKKPPVARHLEDLSAFRRQLRQVLTGAGHCLARADEDVANAVMTLCSQADEIMDAAGEAHDNLASVMAQIEAFVLPNLRAEMVRGKRHAVVNLLGSAQGWVAGVTHRDLCREYTGLLTRSEYLLSCTQLVVDYYEQPGMVRQESGDQGAVAREALEKLHDAAGMLRMCSDSWCILYTTRQQLLSAAKEAQDLRYALLEDKRGLTATPLAGRFETYCSNLQGLCEAYAAQPDPAKAEVHASGSMLTDTCSTISGLSFSTSARMTVAAA